MTTLVLVAALAAAGGFFPPDRPGPYAVRREAVRVPLSSGPCRALLYQPVAAGRPLPGVVFGHGFLGAADRYDSICRRLASHGVAVLAPGFSDIRLFWSGAGVARDLAAGIDFLDSLGVGQVGLVGHSMGGGAALLAASRDPRVRAVAVLSPHRVSGAPGALRQAPALFFAAGNDRTAPAASVRRWFFEPSVPAGLLVTIRDGGHNGYLDNTSRLEDRFEPYDRAVQLGAVRKYLTAFLMLHLAGDSSYAAWLLPTTGPATVSVEAR